ncbi:hypothetical protein [Aquirufa regiilacus]|uniref:Glycoside hydrolase family 65 n=1 Tax=Aquirufa regiilacus TaxID=3024868 RepID=A0ABU3TR90_9BACT|nr:MULTISPECIES: hypothetical protein [unclassified Aquirufa]MDT8886656.1 hypothetical protein [Aquirufa sp. LEPPI-3A]MDU0808379.1 hypothetical protein [Aquirufa sp. LEOWEIH-7C]
MRWLPLVLLSFASWGQKIDRKSVVERHVVHVNSADTLAALSVGNGSFAFTVDVTGLQSFPVEYAKGIPLGTQSTWGWHAFPNSSKFKRSETYRDALYGGRKVSYALQGHQNARKDSANEYFRQNPHRVHLGHFGFRIYSKRGKLLGLHDLQAISQRLNPYTGEIESHFEVEGVPVDVLTFAGQFADEVYVRVQSALLNSGQLRFYLDYPFPSQEFLDEGIRYQSVGHRSHLRQLRANHLVVQHGLDNLNYPTHIRSSQGLHAQEIFTHRYEIVSIANNEVEIQVGFGQNKPVDFNRARSLNRQNYVEYWNSGGMIDFGLVSDKRANELERRMILSMYLTKLQSTGSEPPQETGLTYNSWYGRPHLEMTWWHVMHFGYWSKPELLAKTLPWYIRNFQQAKALARRQGFSGVRWQKMTDPDGGESPSSVGSFLLWQQPHIIDMLDLLAQKKPISFRKKYFQLVNETAKGMFSLLVWNKEKQEYQLGPGIIPAQESLPYSTTYNAPLELSSWYQGLQKAQTWRIRLGLKPDAHWSYALQHFSSLPVHDGIYQASAGIGDGFQNPKFVSDHPAVLGAMGMYAPLPRTDTSMMRQTLQKVLQTWNWSSTWGWDYPFMAMTAVRLKDSELAIHLLLAPQTKNSYLLNGHNYQDKRLRLYLPGNGGLLTTLAWMAKGQMGDNQYVGFPAQWPVKIEGFD